jgi:hypothetical protein
VSADVMKRDEKDAGNVFCMSGSGNGVQQAILNQLGCGRSRYI